MTKSRVDSDTDSLVSRLSNLIDSESDHSPSYWLVKNLIYNIVIKLILKFEHTIFTLETIDR